MNNTFLASLGSSVYDGNRVLSFSKEDFTNGSALISGIHLIETSDSIPSSLEILRDIKKSGTLISARKLNFDEFDRYFLRGGKRSRVDLDQAEATIESRKAVILVDGLEEKDTPPFLQYMKSGQNYGLHAFSGMFEGKAFTHKDGDYVVRIGDVVLLEHSDDINGTLNQHYLRNHAGPVLGKVHVLSLHESMFLQRGLIGPGMMHFSVGDDLVDHIKCLASLYSIRLSYMMRDVDYDLDGEHDVDAVPLLASPLRFHDYSIPDSMTEMLAHLDNKGKSCTDLPEIIALGITEFYSASNDHFKHPDECKDSSGLIEVSSYLSYLWSHDGLRDNPNYDPSELSDVAGTLMYWPSWRDQPSMLAPHIWISQTVRSRDVTMAFRKIPIPNGGMSRLRLSAIRRVWPEAYGDEATDAVVEDFPIFVSGHFISVCFLRLVHASNLYVYAEHVEWNVRRRYKRRAHYFESDLTETSGVSKEIWHNGLEYHLAARVFAYLCELFDIDITGIIDEIRDFLTVIDGLINDYPRFEFGQSFDARTYALDHYAATTPPSADYRFTA